MDKLSITRLKTISDFWPIQIKLGIVHPPHPSKKTALSRNTKTFRELKKAKKWNEIFKKEQLQNCGGNIWPTPSMWKVLVKIFGSFISFQFNSNSN